VNRLWRIVDGESGVGGVQSADSMDMVMVGILFGDRKECCKTDSRMRVTSGLIGVGRLELER
jgi:hypothetical protein